MKSPSNMVATHLYCTFGIMKINLDAQLEVSNETMSTIWKKNRNKMQKGQWKQNGMNQWVRKCVQHKLKDIQYSN